MELKMPAKSSAAGGRFKRPLFSVFRWTAGGAAAGENQKSEVKTGLLGLLAGLPGKNL